MMHVVALVVILGLGLILGITVGRWWALVAAIAVGVWIWSATGRKRGAALVLSLVYATVAPVGISAGIPVRSRRSPS